VPVPSSLEMPWPNLDYIYSRIQVDRDVTFDVFAREYRAMIHDTVKAMKKYEPYTVEWAGWLDFADIGLWHSRKEWGSPEGRLHAITAFYIRKGVVGPAFDIEKHLLETRGEVWRKLILAHGGRYR
jgi:hypothetical protein